MSMSTKELVKAIRDYDYSNDGKGTFCIDDDDAIALLDQERPQGREDIKKVCETCWNYYHPQLDGDCLPIGVICHDNDKWIHCSKQEAEKPAQSEPSGDELQDALIRHAQRGQYRRPDGSYREGTPQIEKDADLFAAALRFPSLTPLEEEAPDPLVELAQDIIHWAEAYPTSVFHEPTPEQAQEAFEKAGFTLDAFSVMVLRVFTKPWADKARAALLAKAEGGK